VCAADCGGETWIDNQSVNWVIEAYRAQAASLVSPERCPGSRPRRWPLLPASRRASATRRSLSNWNTEQVIKNYLRKIYDKLGVSDRLELALYCLHNKIIQTDADEVLVAQKLVAEE